MKLPKTMWILAISLIALLPSVFAQGAPGLPGWMYLVGNTAIIAFVFYAILALVITNKGDKEKTVVGAMTIIAALFIAWRFGGAGWIWNYGYLAIIFSKEVLVNTFIIGTILYFAAGFLKLNEKMGNDHGKIALGILIFIVSVFISIRFIGPQFIWNARNDFMGFLFYVNGNEGGVLSPYAPHYKLFVLITAFTVFAFFFNEFLLKGSNDKMKYVLAGLIALNMAYYGTSMTLVMIIGEVFFTLILEKSLRDSIKTIWFRWIIAILLVGWVSYIISAGTGFNGISHGVAGGGFVSGALWGIWTFIRLILVVGISIGIGILFNKLVSRWSGTP